MAVDVSIVVAIYNAEEYIDNCLDMLTRQTLKNIEIICVDDGSVDKSLEMLQAYSSRDERIRVFTEENKGLEQQETADLQRRLASTCYSWIVMTSLNRIWCSWHMRRLRSREQKSLYANQISTIWTLANLYMRTGL